MIREKLSLVSNGDRLTTDLINKIINRIEYAASLLAQYKVVAGSEVYVEPHFDGTRISFDRPVGGGSQPSFRGGNAPFPNPNWPLPAVLISYNDFTLTYGFSTPNTYGSIPSSSLTRNNNRGTYELNFDFTDARADENGYIIGSRISSPTPFTIYYSDGTFEEAQFDGTSYSLIPKAEVGSIAFSTPTPEIGNFVNAGTSPDHPLTYEQFRDYYAFTSPGAFIPVPFNSNVIYLTPRPGGGAGPLFFSPKGFISRLKNGVGVASDLGPACIGCPPTPQAWSGTGGYDVVAIEFGASSENSGYVQGGD
jgi:hypothetical protein